MKADTWITGLVGFILGAVVVLVALGWGGRGLVLGALSVGGLIASWYLLGAAVIAVVVPVRIAANLIRRHRWNERLLDFKD